MKSLGNSYHVGLITSESNVTFASIIALAVRVGKAVSKGGDGATGRTFGGRARCESGDKGGGRGGGNEGEYNGEVHVDSLEVSFELEKKAV